MPQETDSPTPLLPFYKTAPQKTAMNTTQCSVREDSVHTPQDTPIVPLPLTALKKTTFAPHNTPHKTSPLASCILLLPRARHVSTEAPEPHTYVVKDASLLIRDQRERDVGVLGLVDVFDPPLMPLHGVCADAKKLAVSGVELALDL